MAVSGLDPRPVLVEHHLAEGDTDLLETWSDVSRTRFRVGSHDDGRGRFDGPLPGLALGFRGYCGDVNEQTHDCGDTKHGPAPERCPDDRKHLALSSEV